MDSQTTVQEELKQHAGFVEKVIKDLPYRRVVLATVDGTYDGGNPKVLMGGEDATATIADERLPVLLPYGYTNVKPAGVVVIAEVAPGQFVILGELGNEVPAGLITESAYWPIVTPGSASSSATAITTRAQRLYNEQDLVVSSVAFVITTGGSGLVARVKLYGSDRSTLILDTGDVDCSSTGNKNPSVTPTRIMPGSYIIEVTASATVAWRCMDLAANIAAVMNIGETQRATSHTMSSATTAVEFPYIKFQA